MNSKFIICLNREWITNIFGILLTDIMLDDISPRKFIKIVKKFAYIFGIESTRLTIIFNEVYGGWGNSWIYFTHFGHFTLLGDFTWWVHFILLRYLTD